MTLYIVSSIIFMLVSSAGALRFLPDKIETDLRKEFDTVAYDAGLQARWAPVHMNDCDPKFSFNVDSPARGFNSNRIAIMFWKGAFRGVKLFGENDKVGACSKYAEDAQYAVSRSHVKQLIEPLEKAGYVVDVLLHEMPSCNNQSAEAQLVQRKNKIRGIYGDRIVKDVSHHPTANQFETSTLGAQFVLDFLRETKVTYRSLLIWRFDVLAVSRLGATVYSEGVQSEPLIRDLPVRKYNNSDFTDWSRQGLGIFIEDNIVSMGGWVAPCVLYVLSQGQWRAGGEIHGGGEWRHSVLSNDHNEHPQGSFELSSAAVYRGPFTHSFYSNGAMRMCKMLNSLFAGPTCNLNDIALLVCEAECHRQAGSAERVATCFKKFWKRLDDELKAEKEGAIFHKREKDPSFDPAMDALADDATAPRREDC